MLARLRPRLTYANVVATLALFVALGGSAVAASRLINGRLLRPRSVPGTKLRVNSVTNREVRESSLNTVRNASNLDGLDSSKFLRSDGKATDADNLDGLDSAAFLRPDSAGRAFDASRLEGLPGASYRLTCTGNQRLFFSLCIESIDRPPAAFAAASQTCADLGGRLLTMAELEAFRQQGNITLGGTSDVAEWSGDPQAKGTPNVYWGLKDDGTLATIQATDGGTPYRCAFTPSG